MGRGPDGQSEAARAHAQCAATPVIHQVIGVIPGYHTIAFEAACILAGSPSWELVAGAYAPLCEWRVQFRQPSVRDDPAYQRAANLKRHQIRRHVLE